MGKAKVTANKESQSKGKVIKVKAGKLVARPHINKDGKPRR